MSDSPAMHEVLGADAPSNWRGVLIDMARHRGKPWLDKGAPLKVVSGTGAPVNPVVIR
jgi:hypothetical protein